MCECGCKDLGEDGQLYAVLLGWAALLSWHNIVSGWWSSRHRGCNGVCRGSESCEMDYVQLCALVHTGCTRQNSFSATPTARPTGFAVDVGDQDFRGHRRARAKDLKTENVWGVEESAANKGSCSSNTSSFNWTWQMFVAGLSVGSAPVLIWAGVDMDV